MSWTANGRLLDCSGGTIVGVIPLRDLVQAVGPSVWSATSPGEPGRLVADLFLAEPASAVTGGPEDVVLGVGLASADDAVGMVEQCAQGDAAALVLRQRLAEAEGVRRVADGQRLLLLSLRPDISWTHLVRILSGIFESVQHLENRRSGPLPAGVDVGGYHDLFRLADVVAGILQAPVTIEDNRSRVLAYSSEHHTTDPARVSTIVGRRVPPEVVAHFQARGVFRRLATSSEPFLVPAGPDGTAARYVVPVRAGDEWLGSIWALTDGPVDPSAASQVVNAASVLALHLLRLRAQADFARRRAAARLREVLEGTPGTATELMLPPGPWRVAALSGVDPHAGPDEQQQLWSTTLRRHSWADPQLTTFDRTVLAVVTTGAGPGSWEWLAAIIGAEHRDNRGVCVAAGGPVAAIEDLARSRREALETLALADAPAVRTHEESWAALTLRHATTGLDLELLGGPVLPLCAHDRQHGTSYVETLQAVLRHPGDPTRAAGVLHVHPNTLRHRMKRMTEAVDLDLGNPASRLALLIQLEAIDSMPTRPSGLT